MLAITVGCSSSSYAYNLDLQSKEILAFQARAEMMFPPTTKILAWGEQTGGPDTFTFLKIEVPVSDLDLLINNSPFAKRELEFDGVKRVHASSEIKNWNPEKVKNFKSASVKLKQRGWVNTLIDYDDEKVRIFYLVLID